MLSLFPLAPRSCHRPPRLPLRLLGGRPLPTRRHQVTSHSPSPKQYRRLRGSPMDPTHFSVGEPRQKVTIAPPVVPSTAPDRARAGVPTPLTSTVCGLTCRGRVWQRCLCTPTGEMTSFRNDEIRGWVLLLTVKEVKHLGVTWTWKYEEGEHSWWTALEFQTRLGLRASAFSPPPDIFPCPHFRDQRTEAWRE